MNPYPNMQPQPTQQLEKTCSKKKDCNNEALICAGKDCRKLICRECYETGVLLRNKISLGLPDELAACTLACHKKAMKKTANPQGTSDNAATDNSGGDRLPWDSDTRNKEYQGSSEATLLDWLKTPGEYSNWRGNAQGKTKKDIQQSIADKLNREGRDNHGIDRRRDQKRVGNKIQAIETKFQQTLSFMEQTG